MTIPSSILFVCLGNICRSPSAEAVMRQLTQNHGLNIRLDSAGTAGYHIGEMPDGRAIEVGASLGFDLSTLRARQVSSQDFYEFEVICAMDQQNLANLHRLMPTDATANVLLFDGQFGNQEVADPYYGDRGDFEQMFSHITQISQNWLNRWQVTHG